MKNKKIALILLAFSLLAPTPNARADAGVFCAFTGIFLAIFLPITVAAGAVAGGIGAGIDQAVYKSKVKKRRSKEIKSK